MGLEGYIRSDGKRAIVGNLKLYHSKPAIRLKGTETGGKEFRLIEDTGKFKIQKNLGTYHIPNWHDSFVIDLSASDDAFTAGSVIFAGSDGLTLEEDNANLFWDDTNNYLGIGTATPAYDLHVKHNVTGFAASAAIIQEHATGNVASLLIQTKGANQDASVDIHAPAGSGDVYTHYRITGVQSWTVGIDNDDSDKFKISGANPLGTADAFVILPDSGVGPYFGFGASPDYNFHFKENNPNIIQCVFENTGVVADSSGLRMHLKVANAAAGDPIYTLSIGGGGQDWSMGIDNSDSDKFKIRNATTMALDTATKICLTSGFGLGIFTDSPAYEVHVNPSNAGATTTVALENASDTASSGVKLYLKVAGALAADSFITFDVASITQWSIGIDNSDSDNFKISASTALGTSDMFNMLTTGESGWRGATPVANVNHTIKLFATSAAKGIRIIDSGVVLMATLGKLATSSGGGLDVFNSSGGLAGRFGAGIIGSVHSFLTESWFGLGQAVPTAQLHVESTNAVLDGVAQIHVTPLDGHAIDKGGMIGLRGYTNSTASPTNFAVIAGRKENGTALDRKGYFSLGVNNGSAVVERLHIASDGTITFGIGAIDHGALGGLTGDDHTQYQKETDFTEGSILFRGASAITQDNANLFWDDTNNRLAIGTASPDVALHIFSNTNQDGILIQGSSNPRLRLIDTTNNATFSAYMGDTQASFGTLSAHDFYLVTNDAQRMLVTAAGLYTLYTTSIVEQGAGTTSFTVRNTVPAPTVFCSIKSTTYGKIGTDGNHNLVLYTNDAERVWITAAGLVGIGGTPDAYGALDVQSTVGAIIVPRMTTTQRDALTAANGMILYNSTTNKFQGYEAGAWTNLI